MDAIPASCRVPAAYAELQREHGLLLRYLGQVQQRLGTRLYRLETENMCLRAALVVQRTAWLWGLGLAAGPPWRGDQAQTGLPLSAHHVLCRVGCEGHAHAWLDDDGQCRRTGAACDAIVVWEPGTRNSV